MSNIKIILSKIKNENKETDVLNPLHPLAEWQLAIQPVNPFLLSPIKQSVSEAITAAKQKILIPGGTPYA